jgi:hypothetical protein
LRISPSSPAPGFAAILATACPDHSAEVKEKRHLLAEMAFWDKDPGDDLLRVAPAAQKKTPDLSIRRLG